MKARANIHIAQIIIAALLFSGCERIFIDDDPANDPETNFDLLWSALDEKYSFFIYKDINWDSVYLEYRPKIYGGMGNVELFSLMSDMLYTLKDGHVNLTSSFDRSRNWEWYLNSPPNFNYDIIERNYLGSDYLISGPLYNTIIDSIGYLYYGSFSNNVSSGNIDFVIGRFRDLKGIIIDVRDNFGGMLENIKTIASRFTNEKVIVGYKLYKAGSAHDDFSEPEEMHLNPDGSFHFTKPVIVLTNSKCYSAANEFILTMMALSHVTIMGDTTGGGGGLPISSELPNGWLYRFSSTVTLTPDGFNIEGGIPPDIAVNLDKDDEANGKDTILEHAIETIKLM
jgi:hypothetical protein